MRFVASLFLLLMPAFAPALMGQDNGAGARAMIERAIAAHGGQARLSSVRADKVSFKGTLYIGSSAVPYTNEVTVQAPAQFKSVVRYTEVLRTVTIENILDGERAACLLDGKPQTFSSSSLAQTRQTLQLNQAMKLVPLLTDPGFSITLLGEFQYNGRVVVGIRVVGRGQRDLRLYFDRESALLVKSDHLLDGAGGKDVRQEAFYSDYRDVGGYLRAGKVTAYRDGKKVMEAELVDARHFDHIDGSEFRIP